MGILLIVLAVFRAVTRAPRNDFKEPNRNFNRNLTGPTSAFHLALEGLCG